MDFQKSDQMCSFKIVIKCPFLKGWSIVEFEKSDQIWTFKRVINCALLKE